MIYDTRDLFYKEKRAIKEGKQTYYRRETDLFPIIEKGDLQMKPDTRDLFYKDKRPITE